MDGSLRHKAREFGDVGWERQVGAAIGPGLLPQRDTGFNRTARAVDSEGWMSHQDNTPRSPRDGEVLKHQAAHPPRPPHPACDQGEAQAKLAHELANLLDGGLRNVSMLLTSLREGGGEDADDRRAAARPRGTAAEPKSDAPPADPRMIQRLESVDRALRQMAALVRRWTDHRPAAVRLAEDARGWKRCIEDAVEMLAPAAVARGVDIELDIEPAIADRPAGPIHTVVSNAIRNSLEAIQRPSTCADDRPRITIGAHRDGPWLVLRIADNGPGLNAAVCDGEGRFQAGTTTKPGGHGLGLALCEEIAASLGGTLLLQNRRPRGAELILRIPDTGRGAQS